MIAKLRGVYTALVTPFGPNGQLQRRQLPDLIAFQRAAGVDGVVICGTNGEGVSLSVRERKRLLETALEHSQGIEVMAATGACSMTDAIELTRHASRCGAVATLVLPPFYFKNLAPEGVAAYYRAVALASAIPVVLYSIPQFSGVPVSGALLDLLKDVPQIVGIKESSGDRASGLELLGAYPHLTFFVGSDLLLAEMLAAGAAGVISGTANAYPELLVAVAQAAAKGFGVAEAQARLAQAIAVLNDYPIVGAAKCVIEERGIARTFVRPPLVMPTPAEREQIVLRLRGIDLL